MNPYLEQDDAWQGFHQTFIPVAREMLMEQVRPTYFVKVEEQLFIHELPGEERRLLGRSDVSITTRPLSGAPRSSEVLDRPTPVRIPTAVDVERHSFLEIRDRRNRELVTVLELLSPSNKRGEDRGQYLAKRHSLLRSPVHLVEIDLLRGGPRLPFDDLPECEYCVLVSRAEKRPEGEAWPIRLRDRLPRIPVPLRSGDPDARLDLQALLHRVYDAAGYDTFIYTGQPEPALRPEDAEWPRQFLPVPS
jgi:hypothetical protein